MCVALDPATAEITSRPVLPGKPQRRAGARTFTSNGLNDRLSCEAKAEQTDRMQRALLEALGRMAECD